MAKLKIYEGTTPGTLSQEGYINVATKLIKDIDTFTKNSTTDQARADLLQDYAGPGHTVFQLTKANPNDPTDSDKEEPIDSGNCKVRVEFDERKKGNGNFSKHNIVLPNLDDNSLSTGYLSVYVKAIHDLYGDGSTPNRERACNYLFGLMLVGRCR